MRASLSRARDGYLAPEKPMQTTDCFSGLSVTKKLLQSASRVNEPSVPGGLLDQRCNVRLGQSHNQFRWRS
eukprot:4892937-Pleurochrysis_carterae.AAC.1